MTAGLLFENGPCFTTPTGNGTMPNPYSWNEHVNIIYLDEPIGTGFSYSSDGSMVNSLKDLAVDVYAFLQVFMHNLPQYASLPFHIAAESWGGHYAPQIADYIFTKNAELDQTCSSNRVFIKLASVLIGNGLTEPASQFETIPRYMCGAAPYPPYSYNHPKCQTMRSTNLRCIDLIKACYQDSAKAPCLDAFVYCWDNQMRIPLSSQTHSNSVSPA